MATNPLTRTGYLSARIRRLVSSRARRRHFLLIAEVALAIAHPGLIVVHLAVGAVAHAVLAHRHRR